MRPALPSIVRLARERRKAFADQRPGWMCPKCGSAHGPDVRTCPNDEKPKREVIR